MKEKSFPGAAAQVPNLVGLLKTNGTPETPETLNDLITGRLEIWDRRAGGLIFVSITPFL